MHTGARRYTRQTELWQVCGIAVIGSSHIKAGLPCQDAFAVAHTGNQLIMTLADGAGSAPLGGLGARMAACRCAYFLRHHLLAAGKDQQPREAKQWEIMFASAFTESHVFLRNWADRRKMPLRDLSTTLLAAVLDPGQTAAAQIGDGAIVAMDAQDCELLLQPNHGAHANETSMITGDKYAQAVQAKVLDRSVEGLAMLSDGLEYLTIQQGTPHKPFFEPVFSCLDACGPEKLGLALQHTLTSDAVLHRTDDDKTLILAAKR